MPEAPTFFRYPVDAPVTGGFGEWYRAGTPHAYQHRGIDQGSQRGTPVHFPGYHSGEVVSHLNDGSYGISVCVFHGHQYLFPFTLYAHLEERYVREGDTVEPDQIIGLSGASGANGPNTYDPHHHWQLCAVSTFPLAIAFSADPTRTLIPEEIMDAPRWSLMNIAGDPKDLVQLQGVYRALYAQGWIAGDPALTITGLPGDEASDLNAVLVMRFAIIGVASGPHFEEAWQLIQ